MSVSFLGQRVKSGWVECKDEMALDLGFVLDLQGPAGISEKTLDGQQLLRLNQQVHLCLVVREAGRQNRRVYSVKQVEWRHLLAHGKVQMNLEMFAYRSNDELRGVVG